MNYLNFSNAFWGGFEFHIAKVCNMMPNQANVTWLGNRPGLMMDSFKEYL